MATTDKAIMRGKKELVQLRRCPKCGYFVAEATDIVWKRQPTMPADDGEVESCIFCQQQSQSGDGKMQWNGHNMIQMCSFMKQDIHAVTPNGPMKAVTPSGNILARPGQWIIKEGGEFRVADNP